jgi:uncharacterized protein YecE (DUF72 family)
VRDYEDAVALFWERATALGPALGPVLFQVPPRFADEVFGLFNNDRHGAAVRDADALTRPIATRGGRGIELAPAG